MYELSRLSAFMRRIKKVHFVGIGGVGMSGIAEVMHTLGYEVSGSDVTSNAATMSLQASGVKLFSRHSADNIVDVDVVVISSAIQSDNPDVVAAKKALIPVIPRAEMLAELMRFSHGIAVAGSHGKTTVTSLVTSILAEGDLDPTYVIGGKLNSSSVNARLGTGKYLVAEADESDASFLYLQPMIAIVTNIDSDHLSAYQGDFEKLRQAFVEFLHHLPFYGLAVVCVDDIQVRKILPDITRPVLRYGIEQVADVTASNIRSVGLKTHFDVSLPNSEKVLEISLNMLGEHNVRNALAAICVAYEIGVPNEAIQSALNRFEGIGRRMHQYGEVKTSSGVITLVDDYAHHPTEIKATLSAVKAGWPDKRIVVAFQPHRYSRTRDLFEDFSQVLSSIDVLLVAEVFAAGEEPIVGADGRSLCAAIRARGKVNPVFVESIDDLHESLKSVIQDDDIVLTMGAGSIGRIVIGLSDQLREAV